VQKVGKGLAGRANIVEGSYLLKVGDKPIFDGSAAMKRKSEKSKKKEEKEQKKREKKGRHKSKEDALGGTGTAHFNMPHEDVVLHMSKNQDWPLRLTFVCPPAAVRHRMLVTGKQYVPPPDPKDDELGSLPPAKRSHVRPGIEGGYEKGVLCNMVMDKGVVSIEPVDGAVDSPKVDGAVDSPKPLVLELVGSKLLEFIVQASPPGNDSRGQIMSGVRLQGGWEGREVEFDFKLEGKEEEDENEDERLIWWTSVFKRAVDHANAELDWDDVLGYRD
jgi:hypothetical protein